MARRDYHIDASGRLRPLDQAPHAPTAQPPGRPWLAIYWKCCHTYSRIYRNESATAYEGRCPRCGSHARAGIGPDGSSGRFFTAE